MTKFFKILDLSQAERVFVVGDIHGAYSKLEAALGEYNFNPVAGDHLVSVGDLVDRGPENERVLEFLAHDWFHAVRGNHEQMLIDPKHAYLSYQNGGAWFFDLPEDKQKTIRAALDELPYLMEVLVPSGRRIGIAHASYPGQNWNDAKRFSQIKEDQTEIIWDRRRLKEVKLLGFGRTIENIDHVYYGHTPMSGPFHGGNQSWIDTGAYAKEGYFTIVEIT